MRRRNLALLALAAVLVVGYFVAYFAAQREPEGPTPTLILTTTITKPEDAP